MSEENGDVPVPPEGFSALKGGRRKSKKSKKSNKSNKSQNGGKKSQNGGKKSQNGGKKTRKSKGPSDWNKKVMMIYHEMKKKDKNVKLGSAMKEASRRKKAGKL
jgi:hypothetical protein